jgi:hypothetical protein
VAFEAQRTHVREAAFAAAFHYWKHVIGVPQECPPAPVLFELAAGGVVQFSLITPHGFGVQAAERAHATVPLEDCTSR